MRRVNILTYEIAVELAISANRPIGVSAWGHGRVAVLTPPSLLYQLTSFVRGFVSCQMQARCYLMWRQELCLHHSRFSAPAVVI